MNTPNFQKKNALQLRKEFCKDLCNELVMDRDLPPIYPEWARALAWHMVRLGWKKGDAVP